MIKEHRWAISAYDRAKYWVKQIGATHVLFLLDSPKITYERVKAPMVATAPVISKLSVYVDDEERSNDAITKGRYTIPNEDHAMRIGYWVRNELNGDWHLLVHCMAGVSRSAATLGAILCFKGILEPNEVFQEIQAKRRSDPKDPRPISPNQTLSELLDEEFKLGGRYAAAAKHFYHNVRHPYLDEE